MNLWVVLPHVSGPLRPSALPEQIYAAPAHTPARPPTGYRCIGWSGGWSGGGCGLDRLDPEMLSSHSQPSGLVRSDHPLISQPADVISGVTETGKNILGMGTQRRGWMTETSGRGAELDRKAGHFEFTICAKGQYHVLGQHLRVVEDLIQGLHTSGRHARPIQDIDPMIDAGCLGQCIDLAAQRFPIVETRLVGRESRLCQQVCEAESPHETLDENIVAGCDGNVAILALNRP